MCVDMMVKTDCCFKSQKRTVSIQNDLLYNMTLGTDRNLNLYHVYMDTITATAIGELTHSNTCTEALRGPLS